MRIKLRSYNKNQVPVPVPYNAYSMLVMVITGDESIVFYDEEYIPIAEYDSDLMQRRIMDRIDEMYYVGKDEFEKWNEIKGTSLERAKAFRKMVDG